MDEVIIKEKSSNQKLDLAADTNFIEQRTFGELLRPKKTDLTDNEEVDGLYFFIPSYQRGYRWTKTQIYDLCNDLLDYALKKEQEANGITGNKKSKSFYCLQPIIVIPKKFQINQQMINGYEVVDGQQRLTSMYILFRYLVNITKFLSDLPKTIGQKDEMVKKAYGANLYHIYYETRPNDYQTIEKIGYELLKKEDIIDIDIAHISNAYEYIKQWYDDIREGAPKVLSRYGVQKEQEDISTCLLNLLRNYDTESYDGSVQFIWYELDEKKDAVKEFIKENTGKIKLTDTELIKGLFMQKRNWDKSVSNLQQLSIGKDWELIENILHHNDFWSFLSNNINEEDNRIRIVFEYIYQKHHNGMAVPKDKPNSLFRFYSEYFETNSDMSLLWREVKECFQAMQNWFNDPYLYNLVGLLSKQGKCLYDIINIFNQDAVQTADDFKWKLKKEILQGLIGPIGENNESESEITEEEECEEHNKKNDITQEERTKDDEDTPDVIDNEEQDKEGGPVDYYSFPQRRFDLFYGKNNDAIKNLLLFVNVRQLCLQLDQARKDIEESEKQSDQNRTEKDLLNHIYRFPYDVLDSFKWDIEHIDSATTNELKLTEDKEKWITGAEKTLGTIIIADENYKILRAKLNNEPKKKDANLDEMIKRIKKLAQDDDIDDTKFDENEIKMRKDWIGNLTLLDSGTNRGYGNALFVIKHEWIEQRAQKGVYIPICTRNVFDKNIIGCDKTLWRWGWNDKCCYHKFLLDQYDAFVKEIIEHNQTSNKSIN